MIDSLLHTDDWLKTNSSYTTFPEFPQVISLSWVAWDGLRNWSLKRTISLGRSKTSTRMAMVTLASFFFIFPLSPTGADRNMMRRR